MVNGLSISWNDSWNETSKMLWKGNVHKGSPIIFVNFQHTYRTYPSTPIIYPKKRTNTSFFLRLKCWWINISSINNVWFFFVKFLFFLFFRDISDVRFLRTYLPVPFCLISLEIPTYPKIGRPLWTFPFYISEVSGKSKTNLSVQEIFFSFFNGLHIRVCFTPMK